MSRTNLKKGESTTVKIGEQACVSDACKCVCGVCDKRWVINNRKESLLPRKVGSDDESKYRYSQVVDH